MTSPRDYQPPAWPPGWQPRHRRGEYSIGIETPRPAARAPAIIPDDVRPQRIPPGMSSHRFDGDWVAAYGALSARTTEAAPPIVKRLAERRKSRRNGTRAATAANRTARALDPKVAAWRAYHAALIELIAAEGPLTYGEISARIGRDARHALKALVANGRLQSRIYSHPSAAGSRAQYLTPERPWPPLPDGARPLPQRSHKRKRGASNDSRRVDKRSASTIPQGQTL